MAICISCGVTMSVPEFRGRLRDGTKVHACLPCRLAIYKLLEGEERKYVPTDAKRDGRRSGDGA